MNIAVLISGRGSNLLSILEHENKNKLGTAKVVLVISNNRNAKGIEYAKQYGKECIVIENHECVNREEYDKKIIEQLEKYNVELVVLAGFMRILSPLFVKRYKHRIINVHPALLPSFPGLNAQKQALNYGVKVSGCTVHFVDDKVDHGEIILQRSVVVKDDDTEESLANRILEQEHILLPLAIKLFSENKLEIKERKVIIRG